MNPADAQMARQFFEARQPQFQGALPSHSGLPAIPPAELERFQNLETRSEQFTPMWAEYEAKQGLAFLPQSWATEFRIQSNQSQGSGYAQQGNCMFLHSIF